MRDYWDRYIRSVEHYQKVVDYIHRNPSKAGLYDTEEDWMWSSLNVKNVAEDASVPGKSLTYSTRMQLW